MKGTETVGTPAYTIRRAYLADDTGIAVGISQGQLVVNVGEIAMHMTPDLARRLAQEINVARLLHDMRYTEGAGE